MTVVMVVVMVVVIRCTARRMVILREIAVAVVVARVNEVVTVR